MLCALRRVMARRGCSILGSPASTNASEAEAEARRQLMHRRDADALRSLVTAHGRKFELFTRTGALACFETGQDAARAHSALHNYSLMLDGKTVTKALRRSCGFPQLFGPLGPFKTWIRSCSLPESFRTWHPTRSRRFASTMLGPNVPAPVPEPPSADDYTDEELEAFYQILVANARRRRLRRWGLALLCLSPFFAIGLWLSLSDRDTRFAVLADVLRRSATVDSIHRFLHSATALDPRIRYVFDMFAPSLILDPVLRSTSWGRACPNPLGLAAGFDRQGLAMDGLLDMGFGHAEVDLRLPADDLDLVVRYHGCHFGV